MLWVLRSTGKYKESFLVNNLIKLGVGMYGLAPVWGMNHVGGRVLHILSF